ncbi:hypothetical protein [Nonomuraea sp. NPDC049758]|uniref:hypothetical protein n=1 Tax=Nonomuraea sp. NPDC049758 TaxID=3154360 RepID=UPI00341F704C
MDTNWLAGRPASPALPSRRESERMACVLSPRASVRRRMKTLAVLEFVNIPLLAGVLTGVLGMPLTVANSAGLALVLLVLAEGGVYWWLKFAQLSSRAPVPAGMAMYRLISRINVGLLAAGAVVVGACLVMGASGSQVWPGAALWVFALLEHVNYFHLQLMHDTRADLGHLVRTGRLRRSHLALDMARVSREPRVGGLRG